MCGAGDALRGRKLRSTEVCDCMKEQLSINNYSQGFYFCPDDGGGESYFLPKLLSWG